MSWTDLVLPKQDWATRSDIKSSLVPCIDPCTEKPYADIPIANHAVVDEIVSKAHARFRSSEWQNIPPLGREKLMHALADAIDRDSEHLAKLEALDTGRPISVTETVDIPLASMWLRTYAGWPTKMYGKSGSLAGSGPEFLAYTTRRPVGVVVAIVPWNFPLILAMFKIGPALAAGCTIVVKPPLEAPHSLLRLQELAIQAGIPQGVISVVTGDGETTGQALIQHPLVRKIAFTGSTQTGQHLLAQSVPDLKRITLELGGKSPSIIMPDANLNLAIPNAIAGAFFNSGQVCYAGTRLYVHRSLYDQVVEGIQSGASGIKFGMSDDRSSEMGPLISARQYQSVSNMINNAKVSGADIIHCDTQIPDSGYFYKPTLICNAHEQSEIMKQEVFGPAVSVTPFDDDEQALHMANDSPFGLAAYVWTQNLAKAHSVANALDVGTVFVNCVLKADPAFPFGGTKMSGIGRECGWEALDAYTETKSIIMDISSGT
ncbi:aldehyde dehydrogenase [Glaciecola punicea ACAM 611]|jgi:acyl-CoA reductase-like NAD-dependent aldehyde dehydrogenase|uniref:Aldehyde dehydrogenase n=1 Tax=Glaciecola punicea ACAM 611 TaxID=1121923 RepID=H5TBY9_9ALTE|nr:aldehyde dehydrogenase family protein [Glaciecola punicea]OFA29805.1 betaine-aldehyde dehydrogenase [Glaciecola punicea]GAB55816.1 aldehyde dehydrogenase [Glaciecola punicea ACAM 611]